MLLVLPTSSFVMPSPMMKIALMRPPSEKMTMLGASSGAVRRCADTSPSAMSCIHTWFKQKWRIASSNRNGKQWRSQQGGQGARAPPHRKCNWNLTHSITQHRTRTFNARLSTYRKTAYSRRITITLLSVITSLKMNVFQRNCDERCKCATCNFFYLKMHQKLLGFRESLTKWPSLSLWVASML